MSAPWEQRPDDTPVPRDQRPEKCERCLRNKVRWQAFLRRKAICLCTRCYDTLIRRGEI